MENWRKFTVSLLLFLFYLTGKCTPADCNHGTDNERVQLCNLDSSIGTTLYLDGGNVPFQQEASCVCIITVNSTFSEIHMISKMMTKDTSVNFKIGNRTLDLSFDYINVIRDPSPINLYFVKTTTEQVVECYEVRAIEYKGSSSKSRSVDLSIACSRDNSSTDHQMTTSATIRESTPVSTTTSIPRQENTQTQITMDSKEEDTVDNSITDSVKSGKTTMTKPKRDDIIQEPIFVPEDTGNGENNIGLIVGAVVGSVVLVTLVVITTVCLCRRRRGRDKSIPDKREDESASTGAADDEGEYDMTVNTAYISADECVRDNTATTEGSKQPTNGQTVTDKVYYAVVNKFKKPKPSPNYNTSTAENDYHHLHEVLDKPRSTHVYGSPVPRNPDNEDYDCVGERKKVVHTENVYNTAANFTDNVYNSVANTTNNAYTSAPKHADNIYNTATKTKGGHNVYETTY